MMFMSLAIFYAATLFHETITISGSYHSQALETQQCLACRIER